MVNFMIMSTPGFSNSKHAIATIPPAGFLREGYRRLDVIMLRIRVPVTIRVRRSQ